MWCNHGEPDGADAADAGRVTGADTRSVRYKIRRGRSVVRVRLQDDVEGREGERSVQTVTGRLPRVVDARELLDQALFHREDRVRFDARAARHENVRGQRPVPGGGPDEVAVRRALRVPLARVE